MRKITAIVLALILALSILPVFAEESNENISVSGGCNTLDGQLPYLGNQMLISNAAAAFLYELNTDTVMYAQNADAQVSPASLLKILTALIAIEKGSLTDVVTVKADVLASLPIDAAVVDLVADEVLTVEQLLYCMMVGSGNDAAAVLADHVMGSQQAFVTEMNRYAAELGCNGTNFTNVHGLYDQNQYTTARDIAKILAKAMENEEFSEVFGAKNYTVPETNKSSVRDLSTQNYLINNDRIEAYFDERVIGGRTAVNGDQTRSIASAAQMNDMLLICIIVGAKSQFEKDGYTVKVFGGFDETSKLLDLGFSGNKAAQLLRPGQAMQQISVMNGSSDVVVGSHENVSSVIPDGVSENQLTYRYLNEVQPTAPIEKDQRISTLQIWYGSVCLAQTDLYAMNKVVPAGTQFADSGKNGDVSIIWSVLLYALGGIFVVVILGFLTLLALRASRVARAKRQSRRNSRNRRRSR